MKFLNDFKNVFAIVGVVSIIFWTCASDSVSNESNDDSSLPPQITDLYGKYQVEDVNIGNTLRIVVLNTATGVMKTYQNVDTQWEESPDGYFTPITFTH